MKKNRGIVWVLVLIISCGAAGLASADSHEGEPTPKRKQHRMRHGADRPLHGAMRARMRAHDARLDELVAAMNAAEGEAKIDAVAAVVTELVAQRRTRRDHMEERWKKENPDSGKGRKAGESR